MKRVVACLAIALLFAGVAMSQSLGEAARRNREAKQANQKKARQVYTNDDIPEARITPSTPKAPEPGAAPEAKAADPTEGENKAEDGGGSKAEDKTKSVTDEDAKKQNEALRARVEEQRQAVALLEREINVLQREHQIQTAVFYADAGTRLRNPKDWTDKQAKYKEDMAAKSKALDEAKDKLELLEEEARKAAAPVKVE